MSFMQIRIELCGIDESQLIDMIQILHHMLVLHGIHVQLLELIASASQQLLARLEILTNCMDFFTRRIDLGRDFGKELHGLERRGLFKSHCCRDVKVKFTFVSSES